MIWLVYAYVYLAGLILATHVAFDTLGCSMTGKAIFVILWPIIIPPLYVLAVYRAVRD